MGKCDGADFTGNHIAPYTGTLRISGGELTVYGVSAVHGDFLDALFPENGVWALPLGMGGLVSEDHQQINEWYAIYNSADYTAYGVPITIDDMLTYREKFDSGIERVVYRYNGSISKNRDKDDIGG